MIVVIECIICSSWHGMTFYKPNERSFFFSCSTIPSMKTLIDLKRKYELKARTLGVLMEGSMSQNIYLGLSSYFMIKNG